MNHKAKLSLLLSGLMLIVSAIYVSCNTNVGDGDDPATIEDLFFENLARQLTWTAPGDDGGSGRARIYDLRFFEDIEVAELLNLSLVDFNTMHPTFDAAIEEAVRDNFEDATQIQDEPEPDEAGTPENFVVNRLDTEGTKRFFFVLTARDEVGNSSSPSNVVEVQTPLVSAEFRNSAGGSCFGESVGGGDFDGDGGDFDGDGLDDVVIGDPCLGTVYIFFGRNDLVTGSEDGDGIFDVGSADTADVTIIGEAGDRFGSAVAGVGNIGGGSADDLAIGATDFNGGTGRVFIIFGSSALAETIDFTSGDLPDHLITGESMGDSFGASITGTTGVEGGVGTRLLIGAPDANSGRGKAYLFRGGDIEENTPASDAQAIFLGETAGDMFGFALSRGGDFDDDSFSEFAVGAPGAGKVYVFFGQGNVNGKDLSLDTSGVVVMSGGANEFGTSIAGGQDINEDGEGTPDLLIGAPGSNSDRGSVFLYSGEDIGSAKTSGTPPDSETEFTGESSGDRFGTSIGVFRDINPEIEKQDVETGFILTLDLMNSDFAVGAPMAASGDMGRIYLFFGRNDFSSPVAASEADVALEGNSLSEQFGRVLTVIGDMTGDFIEDFAVGGVGVVRAEF